MRTFLKALALAGALALGCSAANAQLVTSNEFATATPGKTVVGFAIGCLDAGGVWRPQTASGSQCPLGGGGGGSGAVFGPTAVGLAAANPPVLVGGTADGTATGLVSVLKVASGIAFINCANCSGSGISVAFNGAIGSVGTPGGFKDGSGNFQPLVGDVTNGQWVSVKGTLPAFAATPTFNIGTAPTIAVTGTFWPYSLGQQLSAASVPVVLPAAQITALTPPTSVGISGTLPAFAATPTFNIGTAPTIAVTGTFWQATQPVSAASLPLPSGAATQATLASILTAIGSPFQAGGSVVQGNAGSNGQGWWSRLGDGTNGPAAVKAASTAPATTDPALVVALSPNGAQATAANQSSQLTQETATATAAGTPSDTAYAGSGSSSLVAALKGIYAQMATLNSAATTPLNNSSVAINVSTATTTQLVALSGSTSIYVTSFDIIAGGTGNATFVYGTGTNCGTGTTSLTGPYNLTAQAGIAKGAGIGTVLKVPPGNALCITTSAAVQMSGSVGYQQF